VSARAALEALVARLDEVHADPRYRAVWALAHSYGVDYRGPRYDRELEAARLALRSTEGRGAIHSCDDPLCAGCSPASAFAYDPRRDARPDEDEGP
jgi:hypothetical protein